MDLDLRVGDEGVCIDSGHGTCDVSARFVVSPAEFNMTKLGIQPVQVFFACVGLGVGGGPWVWVWVWVCACARVAPLVRGRSVPVLHLHRVEEQLFLNGSTYQRRQLLPKFLHTREPEPERKSSWRSLKLRSSSAAMQMPPGFRMNSFTQSRNQEVETVSFP